MPLYHLKGEHFSIYFAISDKTATKPENSPAPAIQAHFIRQPSPLVSHGQPASPRVSSEAIDDRATLIRALRNMPAITLTRRLAHCR